MKHWNVWIVAALLVAAAVGIGLWLRTPRSAAPAYRFATLESGDLESAISATGRLDAVTTVQVGTQVSGQVSAIYADFNDRVKKGELIARIDPTLAEQAVREAEANLERNRAELDKAERDYARDKALHDQKLTSDSEFSATEYALAVARANAKTGQVALERARRNLAYTSIYAPIDGIVIERNVDVGQTVAASLSAPQIFLIANNLSKLQILASVDESDVGGIREGMPVRFTVQSDPRRTYTGVVRQLRLQPTTTENVVTYTVVIAVENTSGTLLPGMTATVSFITGSASDVLLVPNAALRIRPTQAMLAQAGIARTQRPAGSGGAGSARAPNGGAARRDTLLWYLNGAGKLAAARVHAGISDGQKTEVIGAGLAPGMRVLIGMTAGSASASSGGSSPFQQTSGPGGPPGGFGR